MSRPARQQALNRRRRLHPPSRSTEAARRRAAALSKDDEMPSELAPPDTYRALSITPIKNENTAPVLYELTGDSTEIGSSEDNAIVLADPSVASHHLAVRRIGEGAHLLVDLAARWRQRDLAWTRYQEGDAFWCPRHGSFAKLDHRAGCPHCKRRHGSLWLMRPLHPGDSFEIGHAFRATYVLQERAARPAEVAAESRAVFPASEMFELQAPPKRVALVADEPQIPTGPRPTDDSNLWCWQPEGVPFPIFMHQRVNHSITQHARQNSEREVGGVLLGDVRRDEKGWIYVVVTHAIHAEFANETRGHLTFTHQTWLKIHRLREQQYPEKTIVGWYHTHPGWTIFLSPSDLFIHQNFFKQPWQIALVIDPSLDRAGYFVWKGGQVDHPDKPLAPFRLAELEGWKDTTRPRVRIKLTDVGGQTSR